MESASTTFDMVAALVRRETSMVYDAGKEYLIEARLRPLAAAKELSIDDYVRRLTIDPVERRKVIDALTINETSWFRDHAPYQAFTDSILPRLLRARAATRSLRIWSAACSSGQEAYSLAMLLDQHLPDGWTYEIVATDVSTAMLERVKSGRYSQVEVNRGLPATSLVRYFARDGREWQVVERLRDQITTRHLNLAEPFVGLGTFDLVMLRNVLIYFEPSVKHDILRRAHATLAPHGFLMLGSSETTLDLPPDVAALWRREPIGRVQTHRRADAADDSLDAIATAPSFARPSLTVAG